MKKNLKKSLPAKVENQNTNNNPEGVTPVQAVPVPEVETIPESETIPAPVPTEEKTVITKEYKPNIKEGAKVVIFDPATMAAPDWMGEIPGTVTFTSKIIDANTSGQTLYTISVKTDNNVYNFINASVTQIKAVFGLVAVQRSGSFKVTAKNPEDIRKAVEKYTNDLASAVDKVEKLLAVCGDFHVSINVSGHGDLYRLKLEKEAAETADRIEAAKKAKEAKEAKKTLLESVANMDEITLQIAAAAAAGNMDEVIRLTTLKMESMKQTA